MKIGTGIALAGIAIGLGIACYSSEGAALIDKYAFAIGVLVFLMALWG